MNRKLVFLFAFTSFFFLGSLVALADSSADALRKWGVQTGKAAAAPASPAGRLQPLTPVYELWLALKYVPDLFDDATLEQFVVKEIERSRTYWLSSIKRGPQPWLSEAEVRDRNPKMAAPEFVGRYKRLIRDFTASIPGRVRTTVQLPRPVYDAKAGVMRFSGQSGNTIIASWWASPNGQGFRQWQLEAGGSLGTLAEGSRGRVLAVFGGYRTGTLKVTANPGKLVPVVLSYHERHPITRIPKFYALNRDLVIPGVKMTRKEAEIYMNRYERYGYATAVVDLVVKDGFGVNLRAERHSKTRPMVVLLTDVEKVTLYSPELQVIKNGVPVRERQTLATYTAADFPKPVQTLFDSYRAQAAAEQEKQVRASQAREAQKQEIARLSRECPASGDPKCWRELCDKIARSGDREKIKWCGEQRKQAMKAWAKNMKQAMTRSMAPGMSKQTQNMQSQADSLGRRTRCEMFYKNASAPWFPVPGSAEYTATLDACMKAKARPPYGPDVLGLKLGMSESEASPLLQRQQLFNQARQEDPRPFHQSQLRWSKDGSHGIALFYVNDGDGSRVAAISRRLYFDGKTVTAEQARAGLRKKYGNSPMTQDGKLVWAFPAKGSSPRHCARLAGFVQPAAGWGGRAWRAPAGKRPSMPAAPVAGGNPQQECFAELGMGAGMDMSKIAALQRCMQEKLSKGIPGAPAPGRSENDSVRHPFTVGRKHKPADFAEYRACGPVAIASLDEGASGKVQSVSLLVFDPAWLSELPAFLFESEDGASALRF